MKREFPLLWELEYCLHHEASKLDWCCRLLFECLSVEPPVDGFFVGLQYPKLRMLYPLIVLESELEMNR